MLLHEVMGRRAAQSDNAPDFGNACSSPEPVAETGWSPCIGERSTSVECEFIGMDVHVPIEPGHQKTRPLNIDHLPRRPALRGLSPLGKNGRRMRIPITRAQIRPYLAATQSISVSMEERKPVFHGAAYSG